MRDCYQRNLDSGKTEIKKESQFLSQKSLLFDLILGRMHKNNYPRKCWLHKQLLITQQNEQLSKITNHNYYLNLDTLLCLLIQDLVGSEKGSYQVLDWKCSAE
jgi:hypothetical protein